MTEGMKSNKKLENFFIQYDQEAITFFRVAYYVFLDRKIAEEIVKEVFFSGCKEASKVNDVSEKLFEELISQCRRRLKDRNWPEDVVSADMDKSVENFTDALKTISPKARMVIALFMVAKIDVKEIARLLSMNKTMTTEYLTENMVLLQNALTGGNDHVEI